MNVAESEPLGGPLSNVYCKTHNNPRAVCLKLDDATADIQEGGNKGALYNALAKAMEDVMAMLPEDGKDVALVIGDAARDNVAMWEMLEAGHPQISSAPCGCHVSVVLFRAVAALGIYRRVRSLTPAHSHPHTHPLPLRCQYSHPRGDGECPWREGGDGRGGGCQLAASSCKTTPRLLRTANAHHSHPHAPSTLPRRRRSQRTGLRRRRVSAWTLHSSGPATRLPSCCRWQRRRTTSSARCCTRSSQQPLLTTRG